MMICFYSLQRYIYENAHIRTMTVYTSTIIYLPKTFTLRKQYSFSEMQISKDLQVLYHYFKKNDNNNNYIRKRNRLVMRIIVLVRNKYNILYKYCHIIIIIIVVILTYTSAFFDYSCKEWISTKDTKFT